IYVSDTKGRVHALSVDSGASVWTNDKLITRSPGKPVVVNDMIVVADGQGWVHVLHRDTGALVGRAKTDGSAVRADPILSATGFVLQTVNGGLYGMAVK
ncbi:MAG: PQQ-binding-like beta-propeller repeat protein, partial [Rhodocyclales bacterium]|nr:PQQ-binding-like beta-propeller repeat protein [Rhodocyclales bacterium]